MMSAWCRPPLMAVSGSLMLLPCGVMRWACCLPQTRQWSCRKQAGSQLMAAGPVVDEHLGRFQRYGTSEPVFNLAKAFCHH